MPARDVVVNCATDLPVKSAWLSLRASLRWSLALVEVHSINAMFLPTVARDASGKNIEGRFKVMTSRYRDRVMEVFAKNLHFLVSWSKYLALMAEKSRRPIAPIPPVKTHVCAAAAI